MILFLVVQVLADAFGYRDSGALELQHAQGNAVDVQHTSGAWCWLSHPRLDGDFLGDGEVVVFRCFQSMSQTVTVFSPSSGLTSPVAQQVVHRLVAIVEAPAGIAGHFANSNSAVDQRAATSCFSSQARNSSGSMLALPGRSIQLPNSHSPSALEQGDDAAWFSSRSGQRWSCFLLSCNSPAGPSR